MTIYKKILAFLFCCLLTACETVPQNLTLSSQNRASINSNKIIINSTQHEIVLKHNNWISETMPDPYAPMDSGAIVHQNQGAHAGSGLISELIVSGIKHNSATSGLESIAKVRASIDDFNYMNFFSRMIQQNVAKLSWLKVKKQVTEYNLQATEAQLLASANEDTILLIGTTYALTSTYKRLEVATYVKLISKPIENNVPRVLFANNYFFIDTLDQVGRNANVNKAAWMNNNASMLKAKLKNAASVLSRVIAMDMTRTDPENYISNKFVSVPTIEGSNVKGRVINDVNGYLIVVVDTSQGKKGDIYAVPMNAVKY